MSKTDKLLKSLKYEPKNDFGTGMFIPNHSGDLSRGKVIATPTANLSPVNKKYVDDSITAIGIGNYVPYTGATSDVNLGTKDLTATDISASYAGGGYKLGTTYAFYNDMGSNLVVGVASLPLYLYSNGQVWTTAYLQTSEYFKSTKATGTAPVQVTSTTKCTNLNADMVDGYHLDQNVLTTSSPSFVDITASGEIKGCRESLWAAKGAFSASAYLNVMPVVVMTSTLGFVAVRAGSITGISACFNVTAETAQGNITLQARVNGSNVFSVVVASNGVAVVKGQATQARGTDTFSAGDVITIYADFTTFTGTITGTVGMVEIVYDS